MYRLNFCLALLVFIGHQPAFAESNSKNEPAPHALIAMNDKEAVLNKLLVLEGKVGGVQAGLEGIEKNDKRMGEQERVLLAMDSNLKVFSERIKNVEGANTFILTIAGLVITLATFVGVGGVTFSVWEAKSSKEKMDKAVDELKEKRDILCKEIEDRDREQRIQFDQFERILRLHQMLGEKNFDAEIFYADLSQLAQHPGPLLVILKEKIITEYSENFDQDILGLAHRLV